MSKADFQSIDKIYGDVPSVCKHCTNGVLNDYWCIIFNTDCFQEQKKKSIERMKDE